jgi:DegV family protein with EDD domain
MPIPDASAEPAPAQQPGAAPGAQPGTGSRTAVVTDSTAHLIEEETSAWGITVVPLDVIIAGKAGRDGTDVSPHQVASALAAWEPVSTSRPSPARFLAAYEDARHHGVTSVVSIHLSGELSGTVDAARIAAREASLPVTVVDTRQVGLGFGFAVLAAAQQARSGGGASQVAEAARRVAAGSSVVFYVDNVEYLRRGGRIGAASAFFGGVLAVKPLLDVVDGRIEPLEKVRTTTRALARLEQLAVERAGTRPVSLGVHHLAAPARAEQVLGALVARLPNASPVLLRELDAVIGAHVGPGVVAVVIAPR